MLCAVVFAPLPEDVKGSENHVPKVMPNGSKMGCQIDVKIIKMTSQEGLQSGLKLSSKHVEIWTLQNLLRRVLALTRAQISLFHPCSEMSPKRYPKALKMAPTVSKKLCTSFLTTC